MSFKKGDKKVIKAWVMYDWANSVYPLVITTAIFPLFYKSKVGSDSIVFGRQFDSVEIYSYAIAISLLIVSVLSPVLSGIADFSGSKKVFMRLFNYIGAGACVSLFFWDYYPVEFGLAFCMIANVGFWGSLVFYNAYLPEIAEPKDHDRISAKGFSMGYFGSAILLVACLVLVMGFNVPPEYSFLFVGAWWIGFAQLTYRKLPGDMYQKDFDGTKRELLSKGFKELKGVWKEFSKIKRLKRYLLSFFVFSMAVQTIMTMSQFFGTEAVQWSYGLEIDFQNLDDDVHSHILKKVDIAKNFEVANGFDLTNASVNEYTRVTNAHPGAKLKMETDMIICILLIQLIAIPGAMLFAFLSSLWGNIRVLIIALVIWILICISAYIVEIPIDFYILAGTVGFVMGGVQSLSRSTYSKFLPETEDHASYFSFFDVLEKIGMTIGIVSFGFLTGEFNIRYSIMALTVFFVVGLILLLFVPKEEKSKEV